MRMGPPFALSFDPHAAADALGEPTSAHARASASGAAASRGGGAGHGAHDFACGSRPARAGQSRGGS
jgi:hypothetical protein